MHWRQKNGSVCMVRERWFIHAPRGAGGYITGPRPEMVDLGMNPSP